MKLSELKERIKKCIKSGLPDDVVSFEGSYSEKGQCDITIGIKRNNIALDLIVKTDDKLKTLDNSVDLALEVYRYDLVDNLGFIDDLESPKESVKVGEVLMPLATPTREEYVLCRCKECGYEYSIRQDRVNGKWKGVCQFCEKKQKETSPQELMQKAHEVVEEAKKHDVVNHPKHYTQGGIECIEAMEAMLTPEEFRGFLRGSIFKYQWRVMDKNGVEDLEKCEWYLRYLIKKLSALK